MGGKGIQLSAVALGSIGAAVVVLVNGVTRAAPGDIHSLGALGGGTPHYSFGHSINDSGQVAGISSVPTAYLHAFRYSGTPGADGAMSDLGTLGAATATSFGYGINATGQVTGTSNQTFEGVFRAFRYTGTPGAGGAMYSLGTLGGSDSEGYAINDSGQVTGTASTTGNLATHAFRYTGTPGSGGAMVGLGSLGGVRSLGYAINNGGQVAGVSYLADNDTERAFLYTGTPGAGGAMVDLGTLGGTRSGARAINDAGQVAGYSELTVGSTAGHAFRYSGTPGAGGAMVDLGSLAGGSVGLGINDAGFVVGFSGRAAGGIAATLWQTDAANTIVDLDAWLDATNPALGAYWKLDQAMDINSSGLVTGVGAYNDGPGGLPDNEQVAFILDASSLLVPEPSNLALLASAGAALLRRRRSAARS
jgi:probable HAF family extracellular repeat protein